MDVAQSIVIYVSAYAMMQSSSILLLDEYMCAVGLNKVYDNLKNVVVGGNQYHQPARKGILKAQFLQSSWKTAPLC